MMKRSTVLVIEADSVLSKSIAEFLEGHTYQVTTFADAPAALEYVYEQRLPSIVLLGMNLPSMSGFNAANRLKLMADVPIIFLMARSDRQHLVEGLKNTPRILSSSPSNSTSWKREFKLFSVACRPLITATSRSFELTRN